MGAHLRLPVSNIYNIKGVGQIICGTVEQGTLRPGDQVGFVPSNLKGKKIFSIEQRKKVLSEAGPGNSVGLSIKGIAKDEKSTLVILSTMKRMVCSSLSSLSLHWFLCKNILVSSSQDTVLLSSLVPPRSRAR